MFCYWTIGNSPVHSSKHITLPGGALQKTCRLSPSNSKILAADLGTDEKNNTILNRRYYIKVNKSVKKCNNNKNSGTDKKGQNKTDFANVAEEWLGIAKTSCSEWGPLQVGMRLKCLCSHQIWGSLLSRQHLSSQVWDLPCWQKKTGQDTKWVNSMYTTHWFHHALQQSDRVLTRRGLHWWRHQRAGCRDRRVPPQGHEAWTLS